MRKLNLLNKFLDDLLLLIHLFTVFSFIRNLSIILDLFYNSFNACILNNQ